MSSSTTTVENDYDDQWIKDWQTEATSTAKGIEKDLKDWNQDRINEINKNTGNISNLTEWNTDRMNEIAGLGTANTAQDTAISTLQEQYDTLVNSDPAEITRDSLGETFGSLIDNLSGLYDTVGSGSDLVTSEDAEGFFKSQDFDTSMAKRLEELGAVLDGDEITGFGSFDLGAISKAIGDSEGDISSLQGLFSGLERDDGSYETIAEALKGQKQGLIDDYDLDNLDTRFDTQFGDINKLISGDDGTGGITGQLQEIFGNIGSDTEADSILGKLSGLKSGLAEGLESSATARNTLREQLEKQLGTLSDDQTSLSESLSKGLEGITTDYRDAITSSESGLRDERETAIENLTGDFAKRLQSQEADLSARIDQQDTAFDEKVGKMQSMMNYRMLGDSAGGIKMRRSKAYKSGAVNTGTGQLSRSSLKLNTLNI